MKNCNHCSENIQDEAKKCRHCWEFINEENNNKINIPEINKVSMQKINRIIIIIILFVLAIVIFYLFSLNNTLKTTSNISLDYKKQEKLLKSVVRIEDSKKWIFKSFWSWVVFSKNGLVITNNHVIQNLKTGEPLNEISVCVLEKVWDVPNCKYKWEVLVRNPSLDLAVIKIKNYSTKNYLNILSWSTINTKLFWQTINIYGYPALWWKKVTITKWIVSWYDIDNNIKTDAEISWGNSWWWAFMWSNFIWIPTAIFNHGAWKIGYIVSKNKIYSWFSSILKNRLDIKDPDNSFYSSNILYNDNNILQNTTYKTKWFLDWEKACLTMYWANSFYTWQYRWGNYICKCKQWFQFVGIEQKKCVAIINRFSKKINNQDVELWNYICNRDFWANSFFTWQKNNWKYLCWCKQWFYFWGNNSNECISAVNIMTEKKLKN